MNRTEYMDQLKEALASFDEGVAAEIISDYEEHFDIGATEGKSEEEIAAELGSIDELVKELNGLSSENSSKNFNFSGLFGKDTMNINTTELTETLRKGLDILVSGAGKLAGELGVALTNAAENIKAKQDVKDCGGEYTERSAASQDDIIDTDFTESCDADFTESEYTVISENADDIVVETSGNASYTKDEKETDASGSTKAGIDTVLIEGGCADVILFYNPEGTVTFDYKNSGNQNQQLAYRFYHRVDGNTIRAGVCKADAVSGFFNRLASPSITLKVGIPMGLKKISVKNSSGNITFTDAAGSGYSAGFELGTLSLTAVSGDVYLEPVKVKDFSANTASGDFDVNGLISDSAYINTASGDIEAKAVEVDEFKVNTVSGDVDLAGDIDKLKIHAVSGDIEAILGNPSEADVSTISGDVELNLDEVSGYTAAVKTTSGSVNLDFGIESRKNVNNGTYSFGIDGAKLNINTVSGDIQVK